MISSCLINTQLQLGAERGVSGFNRFNFNGFPLRGVSGPN